jgi:hypothetical protein
MLVFRIKHRSTRTCTWMRERDSAASSSESTSSSTSTSLHSSKQQVDVVLESACCERTFQVFLMFQRYVWSVSDGCCICCNGYTRMLQVCSKCFIYFSDVCCKCVYLNVACILHICCLRFIRMLHILCNDFFKHFSSVFTSVLVICCKCLNYFKCI